MRQRQGGKIMRQAKHGFTDSQNISQSIDTLGQQDNGL
jgi:hypothetical protein